MGRGCDWYGWPFSSVCVGDRRGCGNCVLLFASRSGVSWAAGGFTNGNFASSLTGWVDWVTTDWSATDHDGDGSGSAYLKAGSVMSGVFVCGSSCSISYYWESDGGASSGVATTVMDYATGVSTGIATHSNTNSWTSYTDSLSAYSTHTVMVLFVNSSGNWGKLDSVSLSDATPLGAGLLFDGTYSMSGGFSTLTSGGGCSPTVAAYNSVVGHNGAGSVKGPPSANTCVVNYPVTVSTSAWSVYVGGSASVCSYIHIYVYDMSAGVAGVDKGAGTCVAQTGWTQYTFDMTSYLGSVVS